MNKVEIHKGICEKLNDTYKAKNADYGDSFAQLRQEFPNAILVRLTDKLSRLKTLMNGGQQQVLDESIDDTLLDLANYAIMELVERKAAKGIIEEICEMRDEIVARINAKPTLTAREKGFVECMKEGWIARDRDGCLMWHEEQPWWYCDRWDSDESHAYVCKQYFAFITDEDPWSVEELRKLKVQDDPEE